MASIRVAQAVGIGCSAWLAGNIASISLTMMPALRSSNIKGGTDASVSVKQWEVMYENGKSQNPPVAAAGAAAYLYLAWTARHAITRTPLLLYAGSAVLTLGIVPFTLVAMSGTNGRLLGHAAWSKREAKTSAVAKLSDAEVEQNLGAWTSLNMTRSLLPLAATVVAFLAP